MIQTDIAFFGVYTGAILGIFASGELMSRGRIPIVAAANSAVAPLDSLEWSRKLVHLACGSLLASIPFVGASHSVGIAIGVSFLVFLSAMQVIYSRVGLLTFLFERRQGAVIFSIALIAMSALFKDQRWSYAGGFLVLALADPAAAVFGIAYGKKRFLRKSSAGFLAHFIVSSGVLLAITLFGLQFNALYSLACTLAIAALVSALESSVSKGFDNLLVPISTALLLQVSEVLYIALLRV